MFRINPKEAFIFVIVIFIIIFLFNLKIYEEKGIFGKIQIKKGTITANRIITEVFAIIVCEDEKKASFHKQRQMDQVYALLKSAALLATKTLRFIVLVEEDAVFNKILERTKNWRDKIRHKLVLEKRQVFYPNNTKNMRKFFRVCASARLFLHEALPSEDSVVYLDTDTIFLGPPEDLSQEFTNFDLIQISGMAPCLHFYNTHGLPHYGKTGLNAGVWLMNLTRLRSFPYSGGWTNACIETAIKYKKVINVNDQQIANIIFSKYPQHLYELSCRWNYRHNIRHPCKGVEDTGIFLLHGCAFAFYNNRNQKIKVMYKEFLNFDVEQPLEELLKSIRISLKNIDYSISPSRSTNYSRFNDMLTKSLKKSIQS